MWRLLKEHWWNPSPGPCCCQRNLPIVLGPDCGHHAHLTCTIIATILRRALLWLGVWLMKRCCTRGHTLSSSSLKCLTVLMQKFSFKCMLAHVCVNLLNDICLFRYLLYMLTFPLFLRPLAVLWWAVGTQMWDSQIWFLTRCWGERSRAIRETATGHSTPHLYSS